MLNFLYGPTITSIHDYWENSTPLWMWLGMEVHILVYITISLSSSTKLKHLPNVRCSRKSSEKLIRRPPEVLHTPWPFSASLPLNHGYKTPHQIPLGWDKNFLKHKPLRPLFWQINKPVVSYFTQKSASEIWFSTGAQKPSFLSHYYSESLLHGAEPNLMDKTSLLINMSSKVANFQVSFKILKVTTVF